MLLEKSPILGLALLHLFVVRISGAAGMKNFTYKITGKEAIDSVLMRYPEGKNNALPHWSCEKVGSTEADCELTLDMFNSDGSVTKKFCRSRIESDGELTSVKLQANIEHKVAVSYLKSMEVDGGKTMGRYKFRVMDAMDCTFVEYDIIKRVSLLDLLINNFNNFGIELYEDGSFDLHEFGLDVCKGLRCMTHYDATGRNTSEPKSYLQRGFEGREDGVKLIYSNVPRGNSYFVHLTRDQEGLYTSVQILHSYLDGRSNLLLTVEDVKLGHRYDHDGTEGYLVVCSNEDDSKIRCRRFDSDGVENLDVNIPISDGGTMNDIEVQNLERGEFLVANSECHGPKDECKMEEDFYLRYVRADGQVGTTMKLTNLKCPSETVFKDTKIWLTKDQHVCVSVICLKGLTADVAGSCIPRHEVETYGSNEVKAY